MQRKLTAQRWFEEGIRFVDQVEWAQAKKAFLQALRIQPHFPDALLQLGMLEFREGRLKSALQLHDRALVQARRDIAQNIRPEQWWHQRKTRAYLRALRALGLVYYRMGETRQALSTFHELLRLNPDDHLGAQYFLDALLARKSWQSMDESGLKRKKVVAKRKTNPKKRIKH